MCCVRKRLCVDEEDAEGEDEREAKDGVKRMF